jgi:hypothetical protein
MVRKASGTPLYIILVTKGQLYSFLSRKNPKSMSGFEPTVMRSKWFEVKGHNHLNLKPRKPHKW